MKIESVEKTAKVIAALLKEKFPDVHFHVEAEYPNGTDQVVVQYTDGPSPVLALLHRQIPDHAPFEWRPGFPDS